jgi:hypothetical protein
MSNQNFSKKFIFPKIRSVVQLIKMSQTDDTIGIYIYDATSWGDITRKHSERNKKESSKSPIHILLYSRHHKERDKEVFIKKKGLQQIQHSIQNATEFPAVFSYLTSPSLRK